MVNSAIRFLEENELYPYSVIDTYCIENGALGITFYTSEDLNKFLDILDYREKCDQSGFQVFPETCTVVLSGNALLNFYVRWE